MYGVNDPSAFTHGSRVSDLLWMFSGEWFVVEGLSWRPYDEGLEVKARSEVFVVKGLWQTACGELLVVTGYYWGACGDGLVLKCVLLSLVH